MNESQRRFLKEVAERVGAERMLEVRLFPAIRQGGIESGVAIVAARPRPVADGAPDAEAAVPVAVEPEVAIPDGDEGPPERYEILSARYKLVLKGTERGTWELEVRHEADAPLETIERVVRGVALRAGEDGEPESLADGRLREALSDAPFLVEEPTAAEHGTS